MPGKKFMLKPAVSVRILRPDVHKDYLPSGYDRANLKDFFKNEMRQSKHRKSSVVAVKKAHSVR